MSLMCIYCIALDENLYGNYILLFGSGNIVYQNIISYLCGYG